MVDTIYQLIPQRDRRISIEMAKPDGRRRIIPDFMDEAEANAWIIQTKRLLRAAHPYPPGPKPKDGAVLQIGEGRRTNPDKKPTLKMLVTKSTEGWKPRAANANIGHARLDREQQSGEPDRRHSLDTMQMTVLPRRRNNRVAGGIKAAATKGQEELDRAGSEAAWTKANCTKGSRDIARNPYSRQNFYPSGHPLHPR